jgi:sugar phosphate isomerase/epimerase
MERNLIGLSTTYYATKGLSIYESAKRIVELGFDTIEFGAAHAYENDVWSTIKRIRKDFSGSTFTLHNLFPPFERRVWFNPADGLSGVNEQIVANLFKAADLLGAKLISLHPPILNEVSLGERVVGNFYEPIMGRAKDCGESVRNFLEFIDHVNARSGETGIKVIIENMDNNLVRTILADRADFARLFAVYKNIGMLLDVGHAKLCGNLGGLVKLDVEIPELHLHDVGDVSKRGKWAHLTISDESYFSEIMGFIKDPAIPLIFEHGADVPEEDILREKRLVEKLRQG